MDKEKDIINNTIITIKKFIEDSNKFRLECIEKEKNFIKLNNVSWIKVFNAITKVYEEKIREFEIILGKLEQR